MVTTMVKNYGKKKKQELNTQLNASNVQIRVNEQRHRGTVKF